MNRRAILLGLLSALFIPTSAQALGFIIVGNEPLPPGSYEPELLAVVNTEERVYAYIHDWQLTFYFNGGPKALNEAMRRFAAVPADRREIVLVAGPATPLNPDKPIAFDWCLHVPGEPAGRGGPRRRHRGIGNRGHASHAHHLHSRAPPRRPRPTRRSHGNGSRTSAATTSPPAARAAKELADLGPSVAALLREALKGRVSPEARDRDGKDPRRGEQSPPTRRPGVSGRGAGRQPGHPPGPRPKGTREQGGDPRADAAWYLAGTGGPAEEVVPDLEKLLKTETYPAHSRRWHRRPGISGRAPQPAPPAPAQHRQDDGQELGQRVRASNRQHRKGEDRAGSRSGGQKAGHHPQGDPGIRRWPDRKGRQIGYGRAD